MDVLLLARTALGSALPHGRHRHVSLAQLVEAVLGRGLDKAEQCSAWCARRSLLLPPLPLLRPLPLPSAPTSRRCTTASPRVAARDAPLPPTARRGARPLRPAQLAYAAADAHAVVALYQELLRRRAGLDTPFWVEHLSGESRAGLLVGVEGGGGACRHGGRMRAGCGWLDS